MALQDQFPEGFFEEQWSQKKSMTTDEFAQYISFKQRVSMREDLLQALRLQEETLAAIKKQRKEEEVRSAAEFVGIFQALCDELTFIGQVVPDDIDLEETLERWRRILCAHDQGATSAAVDALHSADTSYPQLIWTISISLRNMLRHHIGDHVFIPALKSPAIIRTYLLEALKQMAAKQ